MYMHIYVCVCVYIYIYKDYIKISIIRFSGKNYIFEKGTNPVYIDGVLTKVSTFLNCS